MNIAVHCEASTGALESVAAAFAAGKLSEIKSRQVALPGWTRLAEQVRVAVADDDCPSDQLTRLVGADAGLAMLVLRAANSPLLARTGKPLIDLRLALQRLSRNSLRSVAFAWALAQVRQAPRLSPVRAELNLLWSEALSVAACARLIAAQSRSVDPDLALLAGLLHNLGKTFLQSQLCGAELPLSDARLREQLLALWHADIGSALIAAWQLPTELASAIAGQDALPGDRETGTLAELLATALIAARAPDPLTDTAEHLAAFAPFGFDTAAWLALLRRSLQESAALRATLSD